MDDKAALRATTADQLAGLIREAKQHDERSFEALIDLFAPRVFGFLYRMTRSRDEAEDLTQEVFVRVVRTIEKYEHLGRFESWIFRIAGNLVRDRIRHRQRTPEGVSIDQPSAEDVERDSLAERLDDASTPPPEHASILGEDLGRMRAALDQLDQGEREVILLRHYGQMSFQDIADLMATPIGTALARAHRGLRKLRRLVEE